MNNPSNDSAMELHSMLNFPDLLDVTKISQEWSSTDNKKLQEAKSPLSLRTHHRRTWSHSPGTYSRWIYTPLKEVKLPQIFQRTPSPSSRGHFVPKFNGPEQGWVSFNNIIREHNKWDCKDCERIVKAPSLPIENNVVHDPLEDMEKYLHNILEDDDLDTVDCKWVQWGTHKQHKITTHP